MGFATVLYGKIISDFRLYFWNFVFFRWDFKGFLKDFGGDFCRIHGGVLICFSYSFGSFLGGFRRSFRGIFLGRIFLGRIFLGGIFFYDI